MEKLNYSLKIFLNEIAISRLSYSIIDFPLQNFHNNFLLHSPRITKTPNIYGKISPCQNLNLTRPPLKQGK
jgi:hypothetical protein